MLKKPKQQFKGQVLCTKGTLKPLAIVTRDFYLQSIQV